MPGALAVIGGGNMGEALVRGLLAAGRSVGDLVVAEVSDSRRQALSASFPGLAVEADARAAVGAGAAEVVLAVKPADVPAAARAASGAGARRLLSVAAGVKTSRIESECPPGVAVLRAMPNTAALVGAAATALCGGTGAGVSDLDWAESVLSGLGLVVRLPESLFDAVTGLSGSGPAYVFLVAEAMVDAGVAAGLAREVSEELAVQTILGAARLLSESGQDAAGLRAMVTSPAGTTAAGLRVLEARALRSAIMEAVAAAAHRSAELG
jgi:pyrroline-5-carboxylate reductase